MDMASFSSRLKKIFGDKLLANAQATDNKNSLLLINTYVNNYVQHGWSNRYRPMAPRTSRATLMKGRTQGISAAQQDLIAHWQSIVTRLNNYFTMMKANNVAPFLVHKVFSQIFSFVNVQLFNSLLLRRECCSFSNGEYVKSSLAELEQWCYDATEEYGGSASAWDDLKHIRQAVGFLVIHQKPKKSLNEMTKDLCPALIIQKLYRINAMYWDDKYGTHTVSADKIETPTKRWKLAPTKREQQKWDNGIEPAKASTGGTDVIIRETKKPRGDPEVLVAQSREHIY